MLRSLLVAATALAGVLVPPPAPKHQDPRPAPPVAPAPTAPTAAPVPRPEAAAADVASVDAIVAALYAVISGPADQKRDFDRMRSLFHPDARLVPIVKGRDGMQTRVMTVDDYVRRSGPMLEQMGFFEQEIARKVETFGDFAHVWSTYEARRAADDAKPFLRGINSIQVVRQGGRWHVLQILWEQEADAGPIPAQYLPAK
jgi:hypothetical protein